MNFLHVINRWFRVWAVRPAGLMVLGVLSALLPFSVLLRDGPPVPAIHDEFAYLLNAETFARGRLANPPVPEEFAPQLETFHELIEPTFIGKYPPGNSLLLAIGILLGHPFFGIILTFALLGPAFAWALRAGIPATWAWVAALAAMGSLVNSYWANSYWGGTLFALEGALIFGGALRLARKPDYAAAFWCGLGAGLAAITRPYEGLWFCLAPAAVVVRALWRTRQNFPMLLRVAGLGALPIAGALVFLGAANHAATGSPFVFPHRLYSEKYMPDLAIFNWEKLGPPPAGRADFLSREFLAFRDAPFESDNSLGAIAGRAWGYAVYQFNWFLPMPFGFIALFALTGLWGKRRGLALTLGTLALWGGPALTQRFFNFPHYGAAWMLPLVLLSAQGARWLWAWRRKLPRAVGGSYLHPAWLALAVLAWAGGQEAHYLINSYPRYPWSLQRELLSLQMTDRVQTTKRPVIIFVHYPPDYNSHDPNVEWVYNDPDWATAPVMWARSVSPDADARFAARWPDHDATVIELTPQGELAQNASGPAALPSAPTPVK